LSGLPSKQTWSQWLTSLFSFPLSQKLVRSHYFFPLLTSSIALQNSWKHLLNMKTQMTQVLYAHMNNNNKKTMKTNAQLHIILKIKPLQS
jgi:hypothetical protein